MIRRVVLIGSALIVMLSATAGILYGLNPAPVVAPLPADAAESRKPTVVKFHARWCVICMVTKDVWADIEAAYAGRVNLVVFDFTNRASTDAGRAEARRLGLEDLFREYEGVTGTVVVLAPVTMKVTAAIGGNREFAEYRAAIDAALAGGPH